jgi:hypothetical protein
MTIDDFEWVENGFDDYTLTHKRVNFKVARVVHFGGWWVHVSGESTTSEPIVKHIEDLEAAKAVAMLYANKHMEKYDEYMRTRRPPDRRKTQEFRPEAVPKGVFKVDRVRR